MAKLAVLGALLVVKAARAAETGGSLSVEAAVGISVAVTVTICALIACVIVCVLFRKLRRPPGAAERHGEAGSRFENQYGGPSGSHSVKFVEEGGGVSANAGLDSRHKDKARADKDETRHNLAVKIASPDDLRFKVCRNADGAILVASDPAIGSRCCREGVREGDQILGVYVNIKAAGPAAHPKEVSELLSLCSDYPLVVEFAHSGPLIRGGGGSGGATPSDEPHRSASAAEAVLRRHRQRVDVVDGPSTATAVEKSSPQLKPARQSRKLWSAPPPPEDRDSRFSIRDRRKRRRPKKPQSDAVPIEEEPPQQPWFERLCSLHTEAVADEAEWVWLPTAKLIVAAAESSDSESELEEAESEPDDVDVALDEEAAIAVFAASLQQSRAPADTPPIVTGLVERVFDYYELEEQDVVAEMPPPSDLRPVVDCCTQYDGAEAGPEDAALAELPGAWESLQNHVIRPAEGPSIWECLANFKVGERSASPRARVAQDDEDAELAEYLAGAAASRASASSLSSSPRTVQEELTVPTVVTSAQRAPPLSNRQAVEDPRLVELSRSMALRDVEVATVILLDAEARRRQQQLEDDLGAMSSGRSTVQEESIDPVTAPNRAAVAGAQVDRDLRNLMSESSDEGREFDYETDEDLAAADAADLNEDFELAAAKWQAEHPEAEADI